MTYIETYLKDEIASGFCKESATMIINHAVIIDKAITDFVHHILRNEVTGKNKKWRKEVTDHTDRWKQWHDIYAEDDICRFVAYEAATTWPEWLEEDMDYGSNNFPLEEGYGMFMEALYTVWLNMRPEDFCDDGRLLR